jgi:hypothetical protein
VDPARARSSLDNHACPIINRLFLYSSLSLAWVWLYYYTLITDLVLYKLWMNRDGVV